MIQNNRGYTKKATFLGGEGKLIEATRGNILEIIIKCDKNTTPIGYDDMTGEFNMRLKAARSWLNLYHKPSINTDKILTILL